MMQRRSLPGWSEPIPVCGFGGWAIGGRAYGPVDRATARAALIRFVELGGVFIDTAGAYGDSEEIIGAVLDELRCRDRVVLATKTQCHNPTDIRRELERSLRRLRTDRIDLYQIHNPPEAPAAIDGVVGTFDGLRAAGLIRRVGASVKGPRVTTDTLALARTYMATGRIDALQVIFSVLRPHMSALWSEAKVLGVTVVARTVLESGFLTGKFPPGHVFTPGDHRHRWPADQLVSLLEKVGEAGTDLAALAVRYALTPPAVNVIIPGAKTPEQVEANWRAAAAGPLPATEVARLDLHFAPVRAFANPPPND